MKDCHSERGLKSDEESLHLCIHKLSATLRWRYFWRKSNQNVGVAIPPHPNAAQCVECYVCYKSGKIINLAHYVHSHYNFTSIFASISPPRSLIYSADPVSLLALRRLRDYYSGKGISPNPFLFAKPQFTKP